MKNTLERMQHAAKIKNGKCLAEHAVKCSEKVKWECIEGHQWLAESNRIYSGKWCKKCSDKLKNKDKIISKEYIYSYAKHKNGIILNIEEHKNAHSKLQVKCENNHIFITSWHNMKNRDRWCNECCNKLIRGKYHLDNIDNIKNIINTKGGKCLSNNYVNAYGKLDIICSKGHPFSMNAHDIKSGRWCKDCSSFKTEKMIRNFLTHICKKQFVKIRPKWLNNLELDGYNEELKIAFEYNGPQHFQYYPYFHKNIEDFNQQQKRDSIKREILKQKNIKLLELSYKNNDNKIKENIIKFIQKNNISLIASAHLLNIRNFIN